MEEMLSFELVIPCFNEAAALSLLIERTVFSAKKKGLTPNQFNLVLVDNGSSDGSQELLKKMKNESYGNWFRIVTLRENLGYGGGILSGLKSTSAPIVGYTHADLQCDPTDAMEAFIECSYLNKKTLIKGRRTSRKFSDWLVSRVYELTVGILWGFWCYELNAQPKVFHKNLVEKLEPSPKGISFDAFVLCTAKKAGFFIKNRKVNIADRLFGESHWAKGIIKRFQTFLRVFQELKKFAPTAQ